MGTFQEVEGRLHGDLIGADVANCAAGEGTEVKCMSCTSHVI